MTKKIKLCAIILLIFCNKTMFAQDSASYNFIKYLSKENKKIELLQYIHNEILDSNSKNYFLAKYDLQYNIDTSFFEHYSKCTTKFLQDTSTVGYTSCWFLQQDKTKENRNKWFTHLGNLPNKNLQTILDVYAIDKMKPQNIIVASYPTVLQQSVLLYKKSAFKSPIKAAMFSAVLPGLGKMYIGKYKIGVNALVLNGMFGLQTYESIKKLGVSNPLSIINMLFCSLFYTSNIYGSYRDTQYFKKENLQQFYQDASNYYSLEYYPVLYK